ncbi:FlxA-like family protein [Chromobacterium phragmitis]|uniref:FlxA-like family protein n=1 Tax=Chromobacterium amazonense TaxID=1382803 RepID=UPI0021B83110|nr:FlxA-like family protein [Chromobacterium amazonense]MBM2883846.1 FlxA-like family protein [Chromobacterium amazonense]
MIARFIFNAALTTLPAIQRALTRKDTAMISSLSASPALPARPIRADSSNIDSQIASLEQQLQQLREQLQSLQNGGQATGTTSKQEQEKLAEQLKQQIAELEAEIAQLKAQKQQEARPANHQGRDPAGKKQNGQNAIDDFA